MLERFIGADTFRDGIRDYLRRHAYGNTETADLWDALGRASGQPVGDIMDTWILQGGYPLIEVADGGTLRQAPFSYSGAPGGAIGADWQVPVLTRPLSDPAAAAGPVLLTADAGGEGDPRGDGSGILVNVGGWGYYRVAYPPATLERLATDIATLEPLERVNLVSDAWAAALAGRTPLADIVRLARALVEAEDRDPSVWSIVLGAVSLWDRAVPDGDRPQFEEAVRTLLVPVATDLGWDPAPTDDERTPALRAAVLSTLGTTGVDTAVRERAETRFAESLRGGGALHPDTEAAVLDIVAAHGGAAEFDAFVERMRHPSTPQEEVRYLSTRWPPSGPRHWPNGPSTWPSGRCGPRTRRSSSSCCWSTGCADRPRGAGWRPPGTRWSSGFRPTSCPACSTASGGCAVPPAWPMRSWNSSGAIRCPAVPRRSSRRSSAWPSTWPSSNGTATVWPASCARRSLLWQTRWSVATPTQGGAAGGRPRSRPGGYLVTGDGTGIEGSERGPTGDAGSPTGWPRSRPPSP